MRSPTNDPQARIDRTVRRATGYYRRGYFLPLWVKCSVAWLLVTPGMVLFLRHELAGSGVVLGVAIALFGAVVAGPGAQLYAHRRWRHYVNRLHASTDEDGRSVPKSREPDRLALWAGLDPSEVSAVGQDFSFALYSGSGLAMGALRLMNRAWDKDGGDPPGPEKRNPRGRWASSATYCDPDMLDVYEQLSKFPAFPDTALSLVVMTLTRAGHGRHLEATKDSLKRLAKLAEKYGDDEYAWAMVTEFTRQKAASVESSESWRKCIRRYDRIERATAAMLRSEALTPVG